jgi:ribosome biogenesis GTPase
MISLENYGWNEFHQTINKNGLVIGRIISIQGFKYYVITANGELETELSGKLMHAASTEELPKLGDWVALMSYGSIGYVIDVLPRRNELSRKNPGSKIQRQILAVNIDQALIVQGLDSNFNLMRLERYIVQLTSCGISPVVILNKADLIDDRTQFTGEIHRLQRDVPVYFCSTYSGSGIDIIRDEVLKKQKTYILIGSSGVGKSSLLNALMNEAQQTVSSVSDSNNKGRHTTTSRELFQLPNGSLLIDTPGMREFGLTFENDQQPEDLFPAIVQFASSCRFSDCLHTHEAGCAVLEAISNGNLDSDVYESYVKLMKEQKRFEIHIEDKKRINKQFGKMTREANDYRKKFKY